MFNFFHVNMELNAWTKLNKMTFSKLSYDCSPQKAKESLSKKNNISVSI